MSTNEPEGIFSDVPKPRIPKAAERQVYTLRIRAEPGVDEIKALRSLLKTMLRRFQFQCLSVTPDKPELEL